MKPIIVHSEAREELDEAIAYYEEQRAGLGLDLANMVEQAIATIRQNPGVGSPYKATEFRRWVVERFPYLVFYAELENAIWIVAVAHARRRPDYWRRRRPG